MDGQQIKQNALPQELHDAAVPGAAGKAPLKVLYAAGLGPGDSSLYRKWALERLGHRLVPLNLYEYVDFKTLLGKITFRLAAGPSVNRLNRDLLSMAERERPDLVWTDKMLGMQPKTLEKLRLWGLRR